jgi:peptidoglycan/LPS O-acetylase OafA/YrhL
MNEAGGVAVVGYDTAVWWRQMARAGAALLFLTTVFLVLSPAKSIGGSTSSSGRRLVALDSLRGVAAMVVVICHLPQTLMNPAWVLTTWQSGELVRTHPVAEFVKFSPLGVLIHGPLMVHVFWVLSGLVLSLPFLQRPSMEKMGESVAKRYFRLMPLALVSTLMAFFFQLMGAGAWWVPYQQLTGWAAGGMMVVWPGGEGNLAEAVTAGVSLAANYNAPLWTIGLELVGSLALFAILACTYTLRRRALIWAVLWAFFAFYTRQHYLADFMAGLLLAVCLLRSGEKVRHWFTRGRTWAVFAGVTILGTASPGWLTPWMGKVPDDVEKIMMILAAAGFVLLAAFSGAAERILTVRPLVWLGERSFAIYVVHGIIQQVLGQGLVLVMADQGVAVLPAVLVSVAVTFLVTLWVADWLTRAVDLPSMVFANRIGRWFSGRSPTPTQPGAGEGAGAGAVQRPLAGTAAPHGAGQP